MTQNEYDAAALGADLSSLFGVPLIAADGSAKWFILSDNGATHNITKDVSNLLPSTVRNSSAGPFQGCKDGKHLVLETEGMMPMLVQYTNGYSDRLSAIIVTRPSHTRSLPSPFGPHVYKRTAVLVPASGWGPVSWPAPVPACGRGPRSRCRPAAGDRGPRSTLVPAFGRGPWSRSRPPAGDCGPDLADPRTSPASR